MKQLFILSLSLFSLISADARHEEFIDAVKNDNVERVSELLEEGVDHDYLYPDYLYHNEKSALHIAAENGSLEMAEILLSHCASVDISFLYHDGYSHYYSPLSIAAGKNNLPLMKQLIAWGACLEGPPASRRHGHNDSPICKAIENNAFDAVKLLLEEGAQPDGDWNSKRFHVEYAIEQEALEIAALLLDYGASPHKAADLLYHNNPLIHAAERGYTALAQKLLFKGAECNYQRLDHKSALHIACQQNNPELVALLLDHGADVTLRDWHDKLPINYASSNEAIAELLLEHGTDCNEAFLRAARYGQTSLTNLLLTHGADAHYDNTQALHSASEAGHHEVVALLLAHGVSPTTQDKDGQTPLYKAIEHKHTEVISVFLKSDRNTSIKGLSLAATTGNLKLVKRLLKKGAPLAGEDHNALHCALEKDHTEVALYLIKHGADVHSKKFWGNTPLHIAAQKGFYDIAVALLEHGAKPDSKNYGYETPLTLAAKNKNKELVALFKPTDN